MNRTFYGLGSSAVFGVPINPTRLTSSDCADSNRQECFSCPPGYELRDVNSTGSPHDGPAVWMCVGRPATSPSITGPEVTEARFARTTVRPECARVPAPDNCWSCPPGYVLNVIPSGSVGVPSRVECRLASSLPPATSATTSAPALSSGRTPLVFLLATAGAVGAVLFLALRR
jgi:hypothetical protein